MNKILITLAVASAFAGQASAVLNFNITNPVLSVTRSTFDQTLTFSGTIVSLNSDLVGFNFSTPAGWSAFPTSDFISYLSQNTTASYSGTVATVVIPGGTAAGTYLNTSTFLAVTDAIGLTDNEYYSVTVNALPVPEPASFAVLGIGVVALMRRRKKA